VQQDGDLGALVAFGARVNLHFVSRRDLHAHGRGLAVDQHPALLNPSVGFAARAQAEFGHAFVESYTFHVFNL